MNTPTTPASGDEPALSDERINEIWHANKAGWRGFARAVIAADRAARQSPAAPAGDQGELPASVALDELFRENAVEMTDRNGALYDCIRAALARVPLLQAVPAGFWLAPMEPDFDMLPDAWREAIGKVDHDTLGRIFRAMRDSWLARHPAPAPAQQQADTERDAARYRWLRSVYTGLDAVMLKHTSDGSYWKSHEALDAAIDAARDASTLEGQKT